MNGTPDLPTFVLPTTPSQTVTVGSSPWTTATVSRGDLAPSIEAQGAFTAKQEQSLFFTISGRIKEVYAVPGAAVTEGEVLAVLDTANLEQTAISRASELTIARLELSKFGLQAETPTTDDSTKINYELDIAREKVKLAQALYDIAQEQLSAATLLAPISGTLSNFTLKQGESVVAYETIGKIADTSEVSIEIMVPTNATAFVKINSDATVWVGGYTLDAHVTAIDEHAILWQGERANKITLSVDAKQISTFDINNSANVEIKTEKRENVLLLPENAVDLYPGQAYVDLVEDGNLKRVPVEVGGSDGLQVEILDGLEEGQTVALP
jgi:RND family efflux transporter MFP subunit